MNISNQVIDQLDCTDKNNHEIMLNKSVIEFLDLSFTTYQCKISIRDCFIKHLVINSAWFEKGFLLENCIIKEKIYYEMGGHNNAPIEIKRNIFCNLFSFIDCYFIDKLILENNIFCNGSTLLVENINFFDEEIILKDNIGDMNINKIILQ